MTMLTVACVFRTSDGNNTGGAYDASWVQKLQRGVARRLPVPHRFVCLSNTAVPGVEVIPLKHDWSGWWSKIELFEPGKFDGPVLYFDLDVMPVGALDRMVGPWPGMVMLRDYLPHIKNSTCMWWDATNPVYSNIYQTFAANPSALMQKHHMTNTSSLGDQGLITVVLEQNQQPIALWQDLLGDNAFHHFSALSQPNLKVLNEPLPPEAMLVYCLWKPKFDAYPDHPLIKNNWY